MERGSEDNIVPFYLWRGETMLVGENVSKYLLVGWNLC